MVYSLTDEHNLAKDLSDLIIKAQVPDLIEVEDFILIKYIGVCLASCFKLFFVDISESCMDVHEVRGQRSNITFLDLEILIVGEVL